jgi:hypothetical protein
MTASRMTANESLHTSASHTNLVNTMKKLTTLLSILAPLWLLPSCIVETGASNPGYNPSSYAPANSYEAPLQAIYNQGYSSGRSDATRGRPSNSAAYTSSFDFAGKVKFIEGYNNGYRNYTRHDVNPGHPQGYGVMTAEVGQGQITIRQGGQVVSVLRTAAPNVEEHHFRSGQQQLVVKSRGNHGPATVELFDVRTGTLRDKVLAFAIQNGQPEWARGMQE